MLLFHVDLSSLPVHQTSNILPFFRRMVKWLRGTIQLNDFFILIL